MSCESIGLLCSGSRSSAEPFANKVVVMMHHHKLECNAKNNYNFFVVAIFKVMVTLYSGNS